jgi:hypothetical protein
MSAIPHSDFTTDTPALGGRLAVQTAALAATAGAVVAFIALAGTPPAPVPPKPEWTGRIGPPALAVTAPAAAGAPKQALTLAFTRPRDKSAYDLLTGVTVRLTPAKLDIALPGVAPGGSAAPLKAVKAGPGVWKVVLSPEQAVGLPGAWKLHVSAALAPGKAFKQDVPLTFG